MNILLSTACLIALILHYSDAAVSDSGALSYLQRFGHAEMSDRMNGGLMTREALRDAVRSFQRFAGLPITGELDEDTKNKMEQPRCGNPDIAGTDNAKRKKRYAIHGSKWEKNDLTYKVTKYTRDISNSQADREIAAAFKWWEDNSDLTFKKALPRQKPDIEIKFSSGAHGDGDPFDGQGNTLAHAYFPVYGGDAHFDDDEIWRLQSERGTVNLRIVAAHEFGHSLGLSHSDVQDALMAPFYDPRSSGLHRDDIRAIQHLYGRPNPKPSAFPATTKRTPAKTTTRRTTTTRQTVTPPLGSCNGRFDAITRLGNGSTYAFLGTQFWRLNAQGADEGFPQSTFSVWGISGKIDGALTYSGVTDIFKGRYVYRFNAAGQRQRGYPKPISTVYDGIPSNIDAAFQWSGNGKLYFIKGKQYWRYNFAFKSADPGYPKPLTVWGGLPEQIDAALQWGGKTYFFSDGDYYRLDDSTINVALLRERPYPRRTDEWWLGCKDNTLRQAASFVGGSVDDDNTGGGGSSSITRSSSPLFFISTSCLVILSAVLL